MRGQALILALVTMTVLVLGVIVLFNTGQVLDKKVELVNAADATAYSVAVQQARAYNAIAYMNRAAVANEVVVAQAVSLYSWTNYMLRGVDNVKDVVQTIAIVLDATIVLAEIGAALQEGVVALRLMKDGILGARTTMRSVAPPIMTAIATSNRAFSTTAALIAGAGKAEAAVLARDLVDRNSGGKARISVRGMGLLGKQLASATAYAKRYKIPDKRDPKRRKKETAEADRYADVVLEVRDGFSRRRSDTLEFGVRKVAYLGFKKRAGTDLVDYRNWIGTDTLNFRAEFGCTPILCVRAADGAIAWGGGAATDSRPGSFKAVAKPGINNGKGWDSPYDIDRGHYKRYDGGIDNGSAGKKVLKDPALGGRRMAWLSSGVNLGLHPYNDTADDKATVPYLNGRSAAANGVKRLDVGPIFTVLVDQPIDTVRTSNQIEGLGGGDLQAPDRAAGNAMTALASAQVYFSRPRELFPRAIDRRREIGNLFSPYWQARLVDTPCAVRREVAIAFGAVRACVPGI